MREYTAEVQNDPGLKFTYSDGMFPKTRPGMVIEPDISDLPPPLPVSVSP
jgi:hypothetical protein